MNHFSTWGHKGKGAGRAGKAVSSVHIRKSVLSLVAATAELSLSSTEARSLGGWEC